MREFPAEIRCKFMHITRDQTPKEVIMGIAITAIISMTALYLSVLGPFVAFFVPLPILFYRFKLGRSMGLLILTAVTLIVISVVGWKSVGAVAFLFELGLVGLILPEVFEMNLPVEKTVGITTGVVLTTGAAMLGLYSLLSATSPWDAASDLLEKSVKLALAMYKEMDTSKEEMGVLAESLDEIVYIILHTIPAIVIAITLFVVWSNLLFARFMLRSKQLFCPNFGRLNQWRAPEPLVWVAIASGGLLLFGHPDMKMLGINGLIVIMMIYFFQGIAIVSFYFEKKQFSKALRALLYALIAMQQLLLLAVIAVGFFDVWIDFRRTRKVES